MERRIEERKGKKRKEISTVLEHICFPNIQITIFLPYYMLMNLFWTCVLPCGEKEQIVSLAQQMVSAVPQAGLVWVLHALCYSCTDFLFPKQTLGSKPLPCLTPDQIFYSGWISCSDLNLNKSPCLTESMNRSVCVFPEESWTDFNTCILSKRRHVPGTSLHALPHVQQQISFLLLEIFLKYTALH